MNAETKPKSSKIPATQILVVALIIGVIVAAAFSASSIVNYMALDAARNATENSPINYMRKNAIIWFDTTSEKSFLEGENKNGSAISNWYETRPINTIPATAIQDEEDKKPQYVSGIFNGLPGLKFDGLNDFMSITSSEYVNAKTPICANNFSIFLVAQPSSNITLNQESLSGKSGQNGQKYALFPPSGKNIYPKLSGRAASSGISFGANGVSLYENSDENSISPTLSAVLQNSAPSIILMEYKDKKPKLYVNDKLVRTGIKSAKDYVFPPFFIGGAPAPWNNYGNFSGYIGEIIIIDRSLTAEEQKDVFSYLKKKWKLNY